LPDALGWMIKPMWSTERKKKVYKASLYKALNDVAESLPSAHYVT